ncbi:alpha-N-acetylgalactosaminide alpha-2,6-sialyltransferase 1 isoform X2 [Lissotriton helveticus]
MKTCKCSIFKILAWLSVQSLLLLIVVSVLQLLKKESGIPGRDEFLLAPKDGEFLQSEKDSPRGHMLLSRKRASMLPVTELPTSPIAPLGADPVTSRGEANESSGQEIYRVTAHAPDSPRKTSLSSSTPERRKTASTVGAMKNPSPQISQPNRIFAKDFMADPQWDFMDQYTLENASRHMTCPDSLKIKASHTDWLKERFLPKISVFMDHRLFSDSEWRRLEHFNPPYGWMGLNYTVVKEVLSFLPMIPNQQILMADNSSQPPNCVTCAVVGNGGILNNSYLGKEIDLHDYVFRVNGAVVQGHEVDVGTRTSFYGFTAFTMLASLAALKGKGFRTIPLGEETRYIHFTEAGRDYAWLKALVLDKEMPKGTLENYRLRPRDDFGDKFDVKKFLVVHPDFMRYIKNRFLRSRTLDGENWSIYRPSTGALLLMTALHLCDKVSAYGFMTDNYEVYSDHYYDKKKKPTVLYLNHDFLLERDLWKKLHNLDILKLYQRP